MKRTIDRSASSPLGGGGPPQAGRRGPDAEDIPPPSAAKRLPPPPRGEDRRGGRILSLGLAAAVLAASPALAQAYADLDQVDRAVAQFTGVPQGAIGGAAMPVDRRLRLTPCRAPLALSWYGIRRDTVEVICPAAGGWKLYVPLLAASVSAAPSAISSGDAVTITVAGDGFAVSQPGEAMEAGPVGAWIKVRTASANAQPLRARVLRPGLVGIELP